MNIKKMRILSLSCLAFLVLACSKDKIERLSEGDETCGVSFALKADYTLNEVVLTRSASVPADEEFKVRIENTRAEILKEWEYGNLPSLIKVVPGSYKLVGWFGSDTLLPAFERPYYYGETKITLKDGDVLDTIVPVKVAATKVAVVFDESFGYDYDDYFVDIKTVGDSLRFLKEETREGYFLPGKLRMRFGLKPKGSDTYYQFYPDAIANVKAKQFYKMTLKAQTKNGALSMISITTDSTTIDIPVEVELPPFYLPKKAPVVNLAADDGMEEGNILTTEGLSKKAVAMITSVAGLTELKIKTVSDTLLNRGWPAEFDLMKATPEQKALLKANGLDWSEDIDVRDTINTTVWVSFNNVVKLLNTAPGQTASSLFEIDVKDRFNQAGNECKFGIKVAPPVFGFKDGEPVEGNIFAKKAIFDLVCEADRDQYFPIVQYKSVGGNWQDASEVSGSVGASMATVNNLAANTEYIFRAVLRSHISPEFHLMTETEAQLPNSGFESWYSTQLSGAYWKMWYVCSEGETPLWNSLNEKTTSEGGGSRGTTSYAYIANSGTLQTSDCFNGSFAALVRTVGWGKGSTAPGSVLVAKWDGEMKHTDPGYLYTGEYSENPETSWTPLTFTSRPSRVNFYYKYTPATGKEQSDDKYVVKVVVENRENGEVIKLAEASLEEGGNVNSYTLKSIPLNYTDHSHRATHIYIMFKSGHVTEYKYFKVPPYNNLSDGEYVGSQLYIDDIELIYE